jgi:hypothetical protein
MSDKVTETDTNEMEYGLDVELSERELLCIGKIVALWGALEYEIFCQTLMCFGGLSGVQLPKEMNNMQFSQVLAELSQLSTSEPVKCFGISRG